MNGITIMKTSTNKKESVDGASIKESEHIHVSINGVEAACYAAAGRS